MEELIKDVKNILEAEDIKKTLLFNYRETLNHFISFMDINKTLYLNKYII